MAGNLKANEARRITDRLKGKCLQSTDIQDMDFIELELKYLSMLENSQVVEDNQKKKNLIHTSKMNTSGYSNMKK